VDLLSGIERGRDGVVDYPYPPWERKEKRAEGKKEE
jgi:hypothetical protein